MLTVRSPLPVEPEYPPIVHCNNKLFVVHNHEPVWLFEAKPRRRVRLAKLAQPAIGCWPLPEVIWAKSDGVKLVGLVHDMDAKGIMDLWVGKANARGSYRRGEAQVQDQGRVGIVVLLVRVWFADIGRADAQDGVILEDPPMESTG